MTSAVTTQELGYNDQRYTISLVPTDPAVHFAAIDHAWQMNRFSKGYLLQERTGLPHVSLCEFHLPEGAEKKGVLYHIFKSVASGVKPNACQKLTFGTDYLEQGKLNTSAVVQTDDRGFWWIAQELSGKSLKQTQKSVADRLGNCTLTLTPPESYRPHLSFARLVDGAENLIVETLPAAIATGACAEFALVLGRTSPTGQLKEILYTTDERVKHGPRHAAPVSCLAATWYSL